MPALSSKTCEDIQRERRKCSFNVKELSNYLDGGPEKTAERKRLGKNLNLG